MKSLKRFYFLPILLSLLLGLALIGLLLPKEFYTNAVLIFILPLMILGIGFRLITHQRLQIIRNQLHQIIQTLEEFDVDEPNQVTFEESPFPVFNELNEYLIELINRVRADYQANKQFTQNASHELQTPLAIIKGHVEILLQSANIGQKGIESLAIVLQNTNRLSKLNSALILLSKIEHQRFLDTQNVNFTQITEEMLRNFHDLIQVQGIEVRKKYQQDFKVSMSSTLAETLIANLIQNAIRHNIDNGFIEIVIEANTFSIHNSGNALKVDPKILFKRFKRESSTEKSLGLGLSIVKRICEQSDLEVDYYYKEGIHTLCIHKNHLITNPATSSHFNS